MFTVYYCIANAHDLRLVGLAAVICAIASLTAIDLLRHANAATDRMRHAWIGASAVSTGFGIWATHFVAMLAFAPGMPGGYNVVLTVISLIVAILLTGAGLAISLIPNWRPAPWIGGLTVAGGIAAMHYTGMAAFELQATLHWDTSLVVASIVAGAVLGAVALPVGLHGNSPSRKLAAALLLTLAICSLHFTAMSAVTIFPDPNIAISPLSIAPGWLALGVALVSFAVIGLSLAGSVLDIREQRRNHLENDRMRGLANAAVEGLVVCDDDIIVTVNTSFAELAAASADALIGQTLVECFPEAATRAQIQAHHNNSVEGLLRRRNGEMVPVELFLREIDFAGKPHRLIAVRDLRERKQAELHIRFLAHHDALTGLANRGTFHERIDHDIAALAKDRSIAVLALDLDHFKQVNDLFGHAAGDRVLQSVTTRISALLAEGQVMARLAGDEFAILMPNLTSPAAAGQLADKILEVFRGKDANFEFASVTTSIGIALYPDNASDREGLLACADTALYRSKADGRAVWRFFEPAMGKSVRDRRLLEHDLRGALAGDQLSLVYQPQGTMTRGCVIGFEALLRWTHPVRGNIRPDIFIPIAEDTGAILKIGEWVLRAACSEAASWTQPLTIAVNVSAVQLHHDSFVATVHDILQETGLAPHRLELEITETALVRDFDRALSTLGQIKAMGVHIAMDDFGTGYSSLSNLRAFPFDKIKIDGSFIKSVNTNDQAAAIIRAVVGLGRGLGLPVLAEGVETEAEFEFLHREKCDAVQGYLLGRPADIGQFADLTHGVVDAETAAAAPALEATA